MPKNTQEQLVLQGRVQFETALFALEATGLELEPLEMLRTIKAVNETRSAQQDLSPEDERHFLSMLGKNTTTYKADIIFSLEHVLHGNGTSHEKLAAFTLLEVLESQ